MFGLGPVFAMIIGPRIVAREAPAADAPSVIRTDIALVRSPPRCVWAIGLGEFLLVWAPAAMLAGAAGIWLFYVQHQFEDAYWQRTRVDLRRRGAARQLVLELPKPLQFFSGNIGYHHVHHLSVRIPNYNLQRAHEENPIFQACRRCRCGTACAPCASSCGMRSAAGWSPSPRPAPESTTYL